MDGCGDRAVGTEILHLGEQRLLSWLWVCVLLT